MVPRKTYQKVNSESTFQYFVFFGEDTLYICLFAKSELIEQGECECAFQEVNMLNHLRSNKKWIPRKSSWKGKRLESSFNTWGDWCSGAIGRGGRGGGLHGGWNPTLGLWPHIGNAYCYSTLQAEAVCTATALSRPAATPQKGEKYAARRAVLHRTCLLAPKHKLYCFGGKTKIFRSTTCSPQRGAPTCLGSRHWLLGGVQGTLGKCSTPGCCTLPCVQQNQDNNIGDIWLHLVKSCQGPHTFSRFIHFHSLKKKCTECEVFR